MDYAQELRKEAHRVANRLFKGTSPAWEALKTRVGRGEDPTDLLEKAVTDADLLMSDGVFKLLTEWLLEGRGLDTAEPPTFREPVHLYQWAKTPGRILRIQRVAGEWQGTLHEADDPDPDPFMVAVHFNLGALLTQLDDFLRDVGHAPEPEPDGL